MAVLKLEKNEWSAYFDRISKTLAGEEAEIEIASLALGDQIEAGWAPLLGIVFDHKNDLIEILMPDLDHMILHPREVYVDYGVAGLTSLQVIDGDDVRQIVKLRGPLALPDASHA
ncbi:hypothetical protein RCH09_000424 [Actimicrobium sp. GrIS 1.19]|uniref:DUF5335 domain-containing protein n=1 Tax=Actimicrobium sp. GrIS 1.19 TaxID=3071708 RepID=UPI002E074DB3|nr:hypothetical protein [Actimicrobium sp. GrIS 1.19]